MSTKKRSVSEMNSNNSNPLFDFGNFFISEEMVLDENNHSNGDETNVNDAQTSASSNTPSSGPYLPRSTFAYTESELINGNDGPVEVKYNIPATPQQDYELQMWDKLNHFEMNSWSDSQKGLKTGMPKIDEAFDGGLKSGFIVIAADSNIGKTCVMSQMAWNVAELNEEAYVMDFSLDDPLQDKLSRVIGCSGKVLINAVKNPKGYLEYPLMLARRAQTLNKLRQRVDRYQAYDATDGTDIEVIEEKIKRMAIELEAQGGHRRLVVFIDNLHDLTIASQPSLIGKEKYDVIAQWCADLAIQYNIPLVCTAEMKKINGDRRPILDDIREAVKIKYEAKAIILVYNEVHYKGEASEIFFNREGYQMKQPVLELHFAKNKISSFKGRLFYEFYPELSRLEEPDEDSIRRYAGLVYS